jgi:hypothetical protein
MQQYWQHLCVAVVEPLCNYLGRAVLLSLLLQLLPLLLLVSGG